MIKFDFNFILKEIVGDTGFSFNEIKNLHNRAALCHEKIINESIGFIQLLQQDLIKIKECINPIKNKFNHMVILGIGGSSLGAKAVYFALNQSLKRKLLFFDNIDPDFFQYNIKKIDLEKTCFAVISKSGSTTETISQFLIILEAIKKHFPDNYLEKLIIITDPVKGGLREFANNYNVLSFEIPENVGGRFSVFSPVGLVPLYFVDIDIDSFIKGAQDIKEICLTKNILKNPAYLTGIIQYLAYKTNKTISVLFAYSKFLEYFTEWYKQLWAESLGKDGMGFTPLKAIGVTDQHSLLQLFSDGKNDKIITFLNIKNFKNNIKIPVINELKNYSYLFNKSLNDIFNFESESVKVALAKKGKINYSIIMDRLDEYHLGGLMFYYMVKTVFTGFLMNINPFDQPGVEEGKNFTYGLLEREGYLNKKDEFFKFKSKVKKEFII